MFCCVNKLLCTVCNWLTVQGFLLLTYSVSCWVSRLCQMWQLVVLYQQTHWLSVPERIQFKLAVLVFCCLHGTAPPYCADQLQPVAALKSRRMLRSSASARLDIPRVRRTTIGDRAFCVAGPRVWNSLSSSTQSAPSLLVFRRLLKCELFHRCANW